MPIFQQENCEGNIEWGSHQTRVTFSLSVADTGEITIEFKELQLTRETAWLNEVYLKDGIVAQKMVLSGRAMDGSSIESRSTVILSLNNRSTPSTSTITLSATALELKVDLPSFSSVAVRRSAGLDYWVVGLRSYGQVAAISSVGALSIAAPAQVDFTKLTGCIAIRQPDIGDSDLQLWFAESDKCVRSILEVLSLSDGRSMNWSLRRFFRGGQLASIIFYGPKDSGPPFESLFHFLNLQPVIDLAVSKYIAKVRDSTGLGIAIEWFVMHPSYTEAQYLAAMTALEHLVFVFARNSHDAILSKKEFKLFSQTVKELIDCTFPPSISEQMAPKIQELNRRIFIENVKLLLTHYHVPLAGISLDQIAAAISVRNKIVHRGRYAPGSLDGASLLQNLAILRELLKRIFLSMLEYEGTYCTFLRGPKWVNFPPNVIEH